jgi:hypothetical protein
MKEIVEKYYNIANDIWGDPQEYKGIKFYPIKLMDLHTQNLLYALLCYPKNHIPDKDILKMSYLKFLIFVISKNNKISEDTIRFKIVELLRLITREINIDIEWVWQDLKKRGTNMGVFKISINDVELSENDFDIIREIVLAQNNIRLEYIEEYNPELEKKMHIAKDYDNIPNFEEEIFIFCAMAGVLVSEIKDYTLYQFKSHLSRLYSLIEYKSFKPLEISGQISSKSGAEIIKHYFTHNKRTGRYDSILIEKQKYIETGDIFKATL